MFQIIQRLIKVSGSRGTALVSAGYSVNALQAHESCDMTFHSWLIFYSVIFYTSNRVDFGIFTIIHVKIPQLFENIATIFSVHGAYYRIQHLLFDRVFACDRRKCIFVSFRRDSSKLFQNIISTAFSIELGFEITEIRKN